MSTQDFAERLAAPTPTPGGGAAAARVGLYACSLLRMVAGITLRKLGEPAPGAGASPVATSLSAIESEAQALGEQFSELEKEDSAAFEAYLAACRLPRGTQAEKDHRLAARRKALLGATEVPIEMLEASLCVLEVAARLLDLRTEAPIRAESDLFAAVELAGAAFRVAAWNIRVNVDLLPAEAAAEVKDRWSTLESEFSARSASLAARITDRGQQGPGSASGST